MIEPAGKDFFIKQVQMMNNVMDEYGINTAIKQDSLQNYSQNFLSSIVNAVLDTLVILNRDLVVVFSNRDYLDLTEQNQWAEQKNIGTVHCYELFYQQNSACCNCVALRVFETGKIESAEFTNPQDGHIREVRACPVFDPAGNVVLVIENIRDITVRKKTEQKVTEQLWQLEHLNRELDEFLYAASHDLQEPLRTISAYCSLLNEDIRAKDAVHGDITQIEEDLTFIQDATERMKCLVSDLLQLSRTGRQILKLEKLDLNKVVNDVLNDLRSRIEETNALIYVEQLPIVVADKIQITRIFLNLIANALKFTIKPPQIQIKKIKIDGYWEISIIDNGIGIAEKFLEEIFVPFKRLHGMDQYEGSGIGLTICRKAIERHGGKIGVTSEINSGSRFFFLIPIMLSDDTEENRME